jgi:hypothetical protein
VKRLTRSKSERVEADACFVGQGQEMQHRVGRPAGGHHGGNGVFEGVHGRHVPRPSILGEELHEELAGAARGSLLSRIFRRDRGVAHRGEAQELKGQGHGIGGVVSTAGSRTRTGDAFQLVERRRGELTRLERPTRLRTHPAA